MAIIIILFALLASLSMISAADDDNITDTQIVSESVEANAITDSTTETTQIQSENSSKNLKSATKYDVNNYTELYKAVNTNTSDKTITINLKGDSKYVITNPIVFNKSYTFDTIIINGNGRVIDGSNSKIFMNISYGKTLSITNVTIQNTYGAKSSTFSNNGTLNLTNCIFSNDCLKSYGLIFNRGNLNVLKCTVNNNITDGDEFITSYPDARGIITNYGAASIKSSKIYNIASSSASFIDNYGYAYISGCNIINSTSDFGCILSHIYSVAVIEKNTFRNLQSTYAGVISNHGVITVKSNNFTSNSASIGGVLYNQGNVSFTSNILTGNNAALGGVIYNEFYVDKNTGDVYGYIDCSNNTFSKNTANIGAIISNSGSITFTNNSIKYCLADNSTFFEANNKTSGTGIIENSGTINITYSNFTLNNASRGAVVYNTGNLSIKNSRIISNLATNTSGFVIENYGLLNVRNSYFNNNTDNTRDMLIYSSNKKYNISQNTYLNNRLNNTIRTSYKNNTIYVNVTLRSIYNSTVDNGSIILYSNGQKNNNATLKNEKAQVDVLTRNVFKTNNMTVYYVSLDKHYLNTSYNFTYNSNFTSYVTINPIGTVVAGDMFTINANVLDKNNKSIKKGYVIFKVNGITLKNSDGSNMEIYLSDSKASINYTTLNNTKTGTYTVEVIYSGYGDEYISTRVLEYYNIENRATITVVTNQSTVKMDQQIKFTATLKRDGVAITEGFVIFKINGITLNDTSGKQARIYLNSRGMASFVFTIPDGWSAKPVKLTVVYSKLTYLRLENKTYFSINKTETHFNVSDVSGTKNKNTTITGQLLDEYDHVVLGTNAVAIKIDGKTLLKSNGKTQYFAVINGTVNISFKVSDSLDSGEHTIEIVTGDRNAYLGTRSQIILTVS